MFPENVGTSLHICPSNHIGYNCDLFLNQTDVVLELKLLDHLLLTAFFEFKERRISGHRRHLEALLAD